MAELRTAHTVSLCTGSSCHPTGLLHGFEYASRLKASCSKKCINLANHRWDLWFSQQWKIGLWSSRLWHCALSQVVSNLSDEPTAATFRAEVSQTGCEYMTNRITNGKRKHMRSLMQALSKKVMKKLAQKGQLPTYNLTSFTSTLKM